MQGYFKLMVVGLAVFSCSAVAAQNGRPSATNKQQQSVVVQNKTKNKTGRKVTGVIKDAATGKPLGAINISIPDFNAALTDDNGRFTINVPDYNSTLFISGEGFQSKEVALRGQKNVSVQLYEESFNSFYDNVVLPFGAKPRNQSVHAVSSINTEGAWNRSTETPGSYLQGKAAGLNPIMRSGTPNVGAELLLRGFNSLYATNQPLIVVDGMIYDNNDYGSSLIGNHYTNPLAYIDIKDIDNITVLKDAVSTYGSKAANGVILITTIHAKNLATKIDAAVYGGINYQPENLPVMNASEYRTYLSDVLKSRGWSSDMIQAQPYMNDDPSNPDYYRYHNNTNWQKQVFNHTSIRNMYLKVTGGDNIAKYALSMGYLKGAGVTAGTDQTKYNVRFNGDLNLSKRLTAHSNLAYTYYEQNLQDQGLAPKTNPIYLALVKAPFLHQNDISELGAVSPNLSETDSFGVSNPVAAIQNIRNNSKAYRFFGSLDLKYQLSRYVSLYSLAGITVDEVREQTFVPRKGITDDTLSNAIADSRLGGQARRMKTLYNNTYIDYSRTFNRIHRLQLRAGLRYLHTNTEQDFALSYNSSTDNFISVGMGVNELRKTGGDIGKYNWFNTYLGANYGLANKYFLSFNMAVDASSRFGDQINNTPMVNGNSLAVLPSLGASWLLSSEKFMADVTWIDLLKLRASYGITGNDDIGNYTAQKTYVSQNLLGMEGLVRNNIGNPGLQWESVTRGNAGLDVAFLNERLNVSADVFRNKTSKMIIYENMPVATGYEYAVTNSGGMTTKGFDLSVSGRIINKSALKWDMGMILSSAKNKIAHLPGSSSILTSFGGATVMTQVGSPANLFYGYKTNGVYTNDEEAAAAGLAKRNADGTTTAYKGGDVRFKDVNGDKVIDENDRQIIGNPNPDFTGAWSNKISWKNFAAEALFTFSKGNDVYNGIRATLEAESNANNQLKSVVNRWRAPGQVTNVPKASWGDPMGNSSFSDRWIEDGSYLRLKEVSVSYNLSLKKSAIIKYTTFYLTGYNLLTFTKYLGYDPEFMASESILARGIDVGLEPQFKSVVAGIRVGL